MAFAALIPLISSALSAMGNQNQGEEKPAKPGVPSVVADRMPWGTEDFSAPRVKNPGASNWEEMQKMFARGGSNGYL